MSGVEGNEDPRGQKRGFDGGSDEVTEAKKSKNDSGTAQFNFFDSTRKIPACGAQNPTQAKEPKTDFIAPEYPRNPLRFEDIPPNWRKKMGFCTGYYGKL